MLSHLTKICPKCNKSRETYYTVEKDPKKKGKSWRIERCMKCAYNFEIEEVKNEITVRKDDEEGGRFFGRPKGGWRV